MQVLLSMDEFAPAARGLALVKEIVRRDVQITVMSSATFEWIVPEQHSLMLESPEDRRAHAEKIASTVVDGLVADGFDAKPLVVEGDAGRRIVDHAREGACDLIVVGGGRHSWLGNLILGSTSTYVLHHAPCAVLVVHEAPTGEGPVHVLIAHDGSPGAERVLRFVEELIDPARVTVTATTVVPESLIGGVPLLVGQPPVIEPAAYIEERLEQARAEAEGTILDAAERLRAAGFEADTVVTTGPVPTQLLKEAEARATGLIVTGSSRQDPLQRLLTGSVSNAIARLGSAALVVPASVS
jgi:nucleotide-binding universal stress UspA family protein